MDSLSINESTFEIIQNLIYILNQLTIKILKYEHGIQIKDNL